MPTLNELQRAFGASLRFGEDGAIAEAIIGGGIAPEERLRIYRNTAQSVLADALRLAYRAVERLVGRDFFDMAAAWFMRECPPRTGYLNDYGGAFADFLAALPSAAELVYLPDVARFEWVLSIAANAPDAPVLDIAMLADVEKEQHEALCFMPHPSLRLLRLDYPADEIAGAVLSGSERAMAAIDLSSGPAWLVVHRGPDGVEARRLDPQAWRFAERLHAGETLGSLIDSFPDLDIARALAEQVGRGCLSGFWLGSTSESLRCSGGAA
jgi:hypothetical protein